MPLAADFITTETFSVASETAFWNSISSQWADFGTGGPFPIPPQSTPQTAAIHMRTKAPRFFSYSLEHQVASQSTQPNNLPTMPTHTGPATSTTLTSPSASDSPNTEPTDGTSDSSQPATPVAQSSDANSDSGGAGAPNKTNADPERPSNTSTPTPSCSFAKSCFPADSSGQLLTNSPFPPPGGPPTSLKDGSLSPTGLGEPGPDISSSSKKAHAGVIAGVVTCVVALLLAGIAFVFYRQYKRNRDRRAWERTHAEIADAVRQSGGHARMSGLWSRLGPRHKRRPANEQAPLFMPGRMVNEKASSQPNMAQHFNASSASVAAPSGRSSFSGD